jgi:putative membrane protein
MFLAKLVANIIAAILGLFVAAKIVPGIEFYGTYSTLIIVGAILGLVNFFIKPILKLISLPAIVITLGLFSIVINMLLVWLIADILFPEVMEISGLIPLFWTTVIIWIFNILLGTNKNKKK